MRQKRILSALIGLVGAVNNNGKTENTDQLLANALLSADSDDIIQQIHREKFTISPNCATCENPCGNTSDYNMKEFEDCSPEVLALKWQIWSLLGNMVRDSHPPKSISKITPEQSEDRKDSPYSDSNFSVPVPASTELPDIIYKSISYLGYNLEQESYESLRKELTL